MLHPELDVIYDNTLKLRHAIAGLVLLLSKSYDAKCEIARQRGALS